MSGTHFIVYAARHGAKSFFEGISDPTFFATINRIFDDGYYKEYKDPRYGEVFCFKSLREFVVSPNGLDIPDWLPFMKALQAQDNGSAAKELYKRMLDLDSRLDPLVGSSSQVRPLTAHGEIGNGREDESRGSVTTSTKDRGQSYLLRRLARDAPDLLERIKSGEFKSARAAAIEAGIITPFPSIALKDPAHAAQRMLDRKGQTWCLQLMEELSELVF